MWYLLIKHKNSNKWSAACAIKPDSSKLEIKKLIRQMRKNNKKTRLVTKTELKNYIRKKISKKATLKQRRHK